MIQLTEEQQSAIAQSADTPPRLLDPRTNTAYVLLRADLYERLSGAMIDDSDFDPREAYPFVDKVMAADDALDPHLDSYQHFTRAEQP